MKYDAGDEQRHSDAAHRCRPAHSGQPIGAEISQRSCAAMFPIFEEHAVDHDLLVEGARQPARLSSVAGILRSRGGIQAAGGDQRQGQHRLPDQHRRAAQAGGDRDRRQPVLHDARRFANACSCRPPRSSSSRTAATARTCCAAIAESIANLYQSNGFRDVKVTARIGGQLPGQDRRHRGLHHNRGRAAIFRRRAEDRRHRAPGPGANLSRC